MEQTNKKEKINLKRKPQVNNRTYVGFPKGAAIITNNIILTISNKRFAAPSAKPIPINLILHVATLS